MSLILKHIQETYFVFPVSEHDFSSSWPFSKRVSALDANYYAKLVPHHLLLNIEYSVLCAQLRAQLENPYQVDAQHLKEQLFALLGLAEIMEQMYERYLNVPREASRFRKHQRIYRQILSQWQNYTFPEELPSEENPTTGTLLVRNWTAQSNLYRQFFVRIKRLLDTVALLATTSEVYQNFIGGLGNVFNPVLPHLAWIFFLPRLVTNLFLLAKHTLPGSWLSEEEQSLPWTERFEVQFLRRWFELSNDAIWVGVGLLNCFILVGALAPIGAYVSVTFFAYDVILSVCRTYFELDRLNGLRTQYETRMQEATEQSDVDLLNEFIEHLDQRIQYEQRRLALHTATMSFLFIAMVFTIPALAFNPIFSLIGAVILVSATVVNTILNSMNEETRPQDEVELPKGPGSLGFFTPKPSKGLPAPEPELNLNIS